jgi:glyoxylase-like metal-dependent hydrolase (beta-lactamase superfamily II)
MEASVLLSPGHTLSSVTYVIGNAAFVHDTVFMPDSGTARADFPGGDARQLWRSIQRILQLPGETRLFTGHDYRPNSRTACWESTVAVQKANNLHLKNNDEVKFVKFRTERDRSLPMCSLACWSCRFFSWISSNRRTFSIAMAAWSAKVVTSSIYSSAVRQTLI